MHVYSRLYYFIGKIPRIKQIMWRWVARIITQHNGVKCPFGSLGYLNKHNSPQTQVGITFPLRLLLLYLLRLPTSSFLFFWSTRRGLVLCCLIQVNKNKALGLSRQWSLHVDETGSREGGLGQQTAVRGKPIGGTVGRCRTKGIVFGDWRKKKVPRTISVSGVQTVTQPFFLGVLLGSHVTVNPPLQT